MPVLQSLSHLNPLVPVRPRTHFPKPLNFVTKLPLKTPGNALPVLSCSSPKSLPATEQEVLQAVVESDEKTLPCVRTYENNLARLTLVGSVDLEQALTAAAADGGEAAAEHIDSGVPAMVVETVFPGPSDKRSTVSTRLVRSISMPFELLYISIGLSSDSESYYFLSYHSDITEYSLSLPKI